MRHLLFMLVAAALPTAVLAAPQQTTVLDVQNMSCGLCPITVKKALEKVPGVAKAGVDLVKKTATVEFDADRTSPAALVKATTAAGFPSTVRP